jgi:hypothetical protein
VLNAAGFPGLAGIGGGGAAAGGLFGGIGGFGAVLAPAAIGGLLGSGLGGASTGGRILGGIGGAIGGIGAAVGIGVGLAGGGILAGALAATGFGLLAAPFLIGAVLLGKAKQRRNDEQAADAIWVQEREQLRELIAAVNADRIDGASALAQASALRAQTISGLNQIKTASVRQSRLTNQLRDLDNSVVAELRAAVTRQASRRSNSSFLVPEFASGGYIPGIDRGYDSVVAKVQPGELVLNRQQQMAIQAKAGPRIFQDVGVPRGRSYQGGGYVRSDPGMPMSITLNFEGDASKIAEMFVIRGATTSKGQRAIVNVIKSSRRNGDL